MNAQIQIFYITLISVEKYSHALVHMENRKCLLRYITQFHYLPPFYFFSVQIEYRNRNSNSICMYYTAGRHYICVCVCSTIYCVCKTFL